jgi:hypothetical protein
MFKAQFLLTIHRFQAFTKRWFHIEKKPAKDKMMVYGEGGDERVKIISTEQKCNDFVYQRTIF